MKLKYCATLLILIVASTLICLSSAAAQDKDLVSLLEKITARVESYPKDVNWKATCIEKESKMNKQWQPEETRTTKSIVKVIGGEENQEILEAMEIKDGKTKDVTNEVIKQAEELREKMKKAAAKEKIKIEIKRKKEMASQTCFPLPEIKEKNIILKNMMKQFLMACLCF